MNIYTRVMHNQDNCIGFNVARLALKNGAHVATDPFRLLKEMPGELLSHTRFSFALHDKAPYGLVPRLTNHNLWPA